jgi:hypothetical protein
MCSTSGNQQLLQVVQVNCTSQRYGTGREDCTSDRMFLARSTLKGCHDFANTATCSWLILILSECGNK